MTILRPLCILMILAISACSDPEPVHDSPDDKRGGVVVVAERGLGIGPRDVEDDLPAVFDTFDLNAIWIGDLDGMKKRGLIRVLTVYGIGRYYIDGAQEKGLVQEWALLFEKAINKRFGNKSPRINVVVIPVARNQLIPSLLAGRGDVIIAGQSITDERQKKLDFSTPSTKPLSEILVTGPSASELNTISDLAGKTLYVRHSSSYRESVEELNIQFAKQGKPPIEIEPVSELLEDDDLVEMVNAGMLPWAIVDDYKMAWWSEAFDQLVVRDDIVFRSGGQIGWGFRKNSPLLESAVNSFLKKNREGTLIGNVLKNRYFRDYDWAVQALSREDTTRFDELKSIFQKYGSQYGIEYLLIAAQGYQESRLDQSRRNRSGAMGVMQIKRSTAGDHNVNIKNIHEVDANIHAGVKYLDFLRRRYFSESEVDEINQILLSLAAYNMGPARVARLRRQAEKKGYDPNVWFDNVELVAAKQVGREPVHYVANIYKYYMAYLMSAEQVLQRKVARERAGID